MGPSGAARVELISAVLQPPPQCANLRPVSAAGAEGEEIEPSMRNEGLRQAPIESATPLFGIAHISIALIDTMLTKITRRSRSYQAASSPRPRHTHVLGIIKLGIMPGHHGGEEHIRVQSLSGHLSIQLSPLDLLVNAGESRPGKHSDLSNVLSRPESSAFPKL